MSEERDGTGETEEERVKLTFGNQDSGDHHRSVDFCNRGPDAIGKLGGVGDDSFGAVGVDD